MNKQYLKPEPLTAAAFSPFGEVIDLDATALAQNSALQVMAINQGLTKRYHALTTIDTSAAGGKPIVSIFHTQPIALPHQVIEMERHPLGSQAFIPLGEQPYYILCAPLSSAPLSSTPPSSVSPSSISLGAGVAAADLQLFITNGRQGVNLRKNTWHHYQLVLGTAASYIVIDRSGSGDNLELSEVTGEIWLK